MLGREEKLYSFYVQCKNKGYKNMQDETESLKAKVIATDMGLRYRDIEKLYQEAKSVYEAEEKRKAHEKMLQETDGQMLVILKDRDKDKYISVFRRADGSVYSTHSNEAHKYEGYPGVTAEKSGVLLYDYHPSQAVYTGASSGGITMGGVHHTEAYMSEKVSNTDKGYIKAKSAGYEITVDSVTVSDWIAEKFRRDEWYKAYVGKGTHISCYDSYNRANNIFKYDTGMNGYYDTMTKLSMAADYERLPLGTCKQIVYFLDKVFLGKYPESDESMYARAVDMEAKATSSKKIAECIALYNIISDYKDSEERIKVLGAKYDEVLQTEKEEAILRKEANAAKRKAFAKKAAVIVPIAAVVISLLVVAGKFIKEQIALNNAYKQAVTHFDSGEYVNAWFILKELDYKDSAELANESLYYLAQEDLEIADYEYAVKKFDNLGEYKDAEGKLRETYDLWIDSEFARVEKGEFKEAIEGLCYIMGCEYRLMLAREQSKAGTDATPSDAGANEAPSYAELPAYSGDVFLNMEESEMTPVMKKCREKITEVQELWAEEEARLAEEAKQNAIRAACESKDLNVFAKYIAEYTPMTVEEINGVLARKWDVKSNMGTLYTFEFDAKGNVKYVQNGKTKVQTTKYTVEADTVNFNGMKYTMLSYGHGHYALVTSNGRIGYLMWHEVEQTDAAQTDSEIEKAAAEAAGQ